MPGENYLSFLFEEIHAPNSVGSFHFFLENAINSTIRLFKRNYTALDI